MSEEIQTKFVFRTYVTPTILSKISGVSHFSKLLERVYGRSFSHLQCSYAYVIIPKSMRNLSNSSGCTSLAICFPFGPFSLIQFDELLQRLILSFHLCNTGHNCLRLEKHHILPSRERKGQKTAWEKLLLCPQYKDSMFYTSQAMVSRTSVQLYVRL